MDFIVSPALIERTKITFRVIMSSPNILSRYMMLLKNICYKVPIVCQI